MKVLADKLIHETSMAVLFLFDKREVWIPKATIEEVRCVDTGACVNLTEEYFDIRQNVDPDDFNYPWEICMIDEMAIKKGLEVYEVE